MRLTNNMIMKRYLRNINTSSKTLNKLSDIATSEQLYRKASEDPAAALKAFNVRNDLSRIDLYKKNIVDVKNILTDVETSISAINDLAIDIKAKIEQAKNTTYTETERAAIAAVLENMQVQILEIVNRKTADRYLFSGSSVTEIPFTVEDGKLLYHGVDVDTGSFSKDSVYIDLGMGMSSGAGAPVTDNTAFDISYPGVNLLGYGVDEDGISNNLYNIISDLVEMVKNNDISNIDKYAAKFENKMSEILVQYADVGEKSNFIDFLDNRLDVDEENFMNKQISLEGADLAEALMNLEYQKLAYNAALKIGATVLQGSLLDYLS
jgi:flagellar hook-associated protein 3 FlgL